MKKTTYIIIGMLALGLLIPIIVLTIVRSISIPLEDADLSIQYHREIVIGDTDDAVNDDSAVVDNVIETYNY